MIFSCCFKIVKSIISNYFFSSFIDVVFLFCEYWLWFCITFSDKKGKTKCFFFRCVNICAFVFGFMPFVWILFCLLFSLLLIVNYFLWLIVFIYKTKFFKKIFGGKVFQIAIMYRVRQKLRIIGIAY